MDGFKELGLSSSILSALEKKGFEEPTPIQRKAIPLLLSGERDIVGQAQTGTGKTAAFGLPILDRAEEKSNHVQALILAPTRELAIQVAEELNSLKGNKKLQIVPIYGGQSINLQLNSLRRGVDIVVGTPGRVIDHLERRTLDLAHLKYVVLDEADEMLNMGFVEDVEHILEYTNPQRRMLLFSATMPERILSLAKRYMGDYELLTVEKQDLTTPLTDQIYFEVRASDKFDALCRIIDVEKEFYGLVFCRTKVDTDQLTRSLEERGYAAEALHGDVSQPQREKILKRFRERRLNILTATDVAARGIDITNLTHVINYSLPQDPESYVHRIGRTGRAGKQGTAITFITPSEFRRLAFIKKAAQANIRKGKLPGEREILEARMANMREEISGIITNKQYQDYQKLAAGLLQEHEAEQAVAALLKHIFQIELTEPAAEPERTPNADRYIEETGGKTRLYVARGKKDGLTAKQLVRFIKGESGLPDSHINDIEIYDSFSFVSIPFTEAEQVLEMLNQRTGEKRPVFKLASEKQEFSGKKKGVKSKKKK